MSGPSSAPHPRQPHRPENRDQAGESSNPLSTFLQLTKIAVRNAFMADAPRNRRLTPEEIARRKAKTMPTPDMPADPGRRAAFLTAGGAALGAVIGAAAWRMNTNSTPAAPTSREQSPQHREQRETYPQKNAWMDDAITAQQKILTTDPAERTAYYLDDALDIVDEKPYRTFTVDPRNPKLRPPEGAIIFPARQPKQSSSAYEAIKDKAVSDWHDSNRRAYGKASGKAISTKEDSPMANVSPNHGSTFQDTWKAAEEHITTVQSTFSKTFKKTRLYQDMPETARGTMIRICTQGQISNESKWESGAVSNSAEPARGPWQIKPSTANDATRKNPNKLTVAANEDGSYNLHDFEQATMVAVLCYEQIYATLKPAMEEVQSKFKLNDETFYEDFVIPCLVNAYHNGQGGMQKVINWFLKNYSAKSVAKKLGPDANQYGSNLYFFMSRAYFSHAEDGNYGRRSLMYVPKCYAYARLFDQELSQMASQE